MCRSSTAAEVQTGSHAVDAHEFAKQVIIEWHNEKPVPVKFLDQAMSTIPSVVITDRKNLYDSVVRIESSGLQLEEKRLALEILSLRERVSATGMQYKWVDADQQLGDPLSKPFVYDNMLIALQKGRLALQFDEGFMSAKRKRAGRKQGHVQKPASPAETSQSTQQEKSFTSVNQSPLLC